MAKYSLAKHILTIKIPQSVASLFGANALTIGGSGSYVNSISIEQTANMWEVQGDATGSHIYNRNDDKSGYIDIQIHQLSDKVRLLKTLINVYRSSQAIEEGLTVELRSIDGTLIATCNDCMPQKTPSQNFGATSEFQSWRILSGEITFN